jgi:hypothetical protein
MGGNTLGAARRIGCVRHPRSRLAIRASIAMVVLGLAGCSKAQGSPGPRSSAGRVTGGGHGSASCAFVVQFRGHPFDVIEVDVEPVPGTKLGEAMSPGCNDTGGASSEPNQRLPVAELPGVDPGVAVVWLDATDRIFVRHGVPLPPEIRKLLHAPACDPVDAPVFLHGPWLGILGADGKTELDLVPPYDLQMLVRQASSSRYERSHLTIRVPASLGQPLSREDVRSSLWKGGTIRVTATCVDGRFIAQRVAAFPPA